MGRTVPSWRMVMHHELKNLEKFAYHLRVDDREVFEDMMLQCELYCPHAGDMASPVKEIPLLVSIIFGQHKMILDLQRKILSLEEPQKQQ